MNEANFQEITFWIPCTKHHPASQVIRDTESLVEFRKRQDKAHNGSVHLHSSPFCSKCHETINLSPLVVMQHPLPLDKESLEVHSSNYQVQRLSRRFSCTVRGGNYRDRLDLQLQFAPELPGIRDWLGSTPRISGQVGLGVNPRICISNKFPRNPDADGHLGNN